MKAKNWMDSLKIQYEPSTWAAVRIVSKSEEEFRVAKLSIEEQGMKSSATTEAFYLKINFGNIGWDSLFSFVVMLSQW